MSNQQPELLVLYENLIWCVVPRNFLQQLCVKKGLYFEGKENNIVVYLKPQTSLIHTGSIYYCQPNNIWLETTEKTTAASAAGWEFDVQLL